MSRAASLRVSTSDTSTTNRPDTSRRESRTLRVMAYLKQQPNRMASARDCAQLGLKTINLSSGNLFKVMQPAMQCGWVEFDWASATLYLTSAGLDVLQASVLGTHLNIPEAHARPAHFGEHHIPIRPGPRGGLPTEALPAHIGAPLPRQQACRRHWIPSRYSDTLRWRSGHQCHAHDTAARARIEALLRNSGGRAEACGIHHPTVTA